MPSSNGREGKKVRNDGKNEKTEMSLKSKKNTNKLANLKTEEAQRLLESVRRALLAAYAMAVATTGTSTKHYRGASMLLGTSQKQ